MGINGKKRSQDSHEKRKMLKPTVDISQDTADKPDYYIGTWEEAEDFQRDNEYIKAGYRINFCSFDRVLRSLFMCHNETTNVWSHLIGVFIFIGFTIYISVIVAPIEKFPSFSIIRNQFSSNFSKTCFDPVWNTEDKSHKWALTQIKECQNEIGQVLKSFGRSLTSVPPQNRMTYVVDNIEYLPAYIKENIFHIINNKSSLYKIGEEGIIADIPKWPLYIHMAGAIACMMCSSSFHLLYMMNRFFHTIMSRVDYSGISFLIAGSTFPPLIYGYACTTVTKIVYIILIDTFCLLAFLMTICPNIVNPRFRALRGFVYIAVGLLAGAPGFQLLFVNDSTVVMRIFYWLLGGILYVSGALIYIARIPERWFPGKFDKFGHGHNWFHFFVLIAAICHFFGSLECYHNRKNNLCDPIYQLSFLSLIHI
eukprot:TRINITY_DN5571_c0_g1_i4.p1 TRINITY_DN5571_c0_g1~~TRINITY_DN5571_c0_g1_i4.p1  ORF type:complete len:436 (-),score=31.65 TRINITY_DN5571_c0_g1_i4:61-1329(-)